VRPRQLVDHLDADQGGVHVHHDQALCLRPEQRLALERAVEGALSRRLQERALERSVLAGSEMGELPRR